ncbi:hypothetical protein C0214_23935 [Methylobacterium sp. DM1]|nr:hypothetical protein C0214_23935 [Methylobacterium sp. DM1]
MNPPIIIVFGLSGVGKTTLCKAFVHQHPHYIYLSASQMLREATGRMPEELRMSDPQAIQERQKLLSAVLEEKRKGREGAPVLIDAHSVIDNNNTIVSVPISAIAAMRPTGLAFIEADPVAILQRRATDSRDRPIRTIDELRQQQLFAKEIAHEYAEKLDLPINLGRIQNVDDLHAFIKSAS